MTSLADPCSIGPVMGKALHEGGPATAWVHPTRRGLWFRRCGGEDRLPASLEHVEQACRRSRLRHGAVSVETAEHLLAALSGLGHWHACIELDACEPPILDGSALGWVERLDAARWAPRDPGRRCVVRRTLEVCDGPARCLLEPAALSTIECRIAFDHPAIGQQQAAWQVGDVATFCREIAGARTFGFLAERERLHRAGLARGASAENVLVFDERGPLGALRFADEPVRHKLLDAIGDLALLGAPLQGRVLVERASHALLTRTLKQALATGAITRADN